MRYPFVQNNRRQETLSSAFPLPESETVLPLPYFFLFLSFSFPFSFLFLSSSFPLPFLFLSSSFCFLFFSFSFPFLLLSSSVPFPFSFLSFPFLFLFGSFSFPLSYKTTKPWVAIGPPKAIPFLGSLAKTMSFDYCSHVYHAYVYFEGQGRCLVLMFFSFFWMGCFFSFPN